MMRIILNQLLAMLLAFGCVSGAHAQGAGTKNNGASAPPSTGRGIETGHGPLSQPIAPAVSMINSQNRQRSQNMQGPVQTNPPQQPFGSR